MVGALSAAPARARPRRLLIVAGEASGDTHGARLVDALRTHGDVQVRGVAGPALRAAGVEPVVPQEDLAVIGFSGVLARLPALLAARRALLAELDRFRPDAVVLVDYPGFNLRLGPQLKARGARVFYYIAPQVWAWHPERARAMAAWVDRLAVVFPFEEAIFREAGVTVSFVGHPLLDDFAPEVTEHQLRAELGVEATTRIVGLLPGSRGEELRRHAGILLDAAQRLRERFVDVVPVVALAAGRTLEGLSLRQLEGVRVVRDRTRAVQAMASACVVASGTATLETALVGTPLCIVYRTGWLNAFLARRLVTLPWIGLPNIVAGARVAPELLQGALTPEAVADVLGHWLEDRAEIARVRAGLAVVRDRLGGPGASARCAELLWGMTA